MSDEDKNKEDLTVTDPETNEEFKITFAPGALDMFETQEELDEFMAELNKQIADGSFFANSNELTEEDIDDLPEEVKAALFRDIDETEEERRRRLN